MEVVGERGLLDETINLIHKKRRMLYCLILALHRLRVLMQYHSYVNIHQLKVIALPMHSKPAYAKKKLQLGAKDYVTKNSSCQEMLDAIEGVKGGIYMFRNKGYPIRPSVGAK